LELRLVVSKATSLSTISRLAGLTGTVAVFAVVSMAPDIGAGG
jgi:hypothetical protein